VVDERRATRREHAAGLRDGGAHHVHVDVDQSVEADREVDDPWGTIGRVRPSFW
jgi:hypothetical protein